jgi:RNA polymerase sigma-70 factor (ECF subfamily)
MAEEPSDDDLMRAYARGDARAFERLYRRHAGPLYRFVRRLLGRQGSGHVDEVFQDTWARVVHARERWAPQGAAFRTWLFTIAQRRAIDLLRRSGREQPWDDEAEPFAPPGAAWQGWPAAPGDAEGPVERSFWRAAGRRLLDCLEMLPEAQRAVFLLHHEDGLSLADAAARLELGFETAKSRLRYAMSKLRSCMGAYLPAPEPGA